MAVSTILALRRGFSVTGVRSLWTSRAALTSQTNQANQTNNANEDKKHENEEEYEKKIRTQILSASIPFVKEHGWSEDAISAGAESIGYPGVIHGLFPKGGVELVLHFYADCNAELNRILKAESLAIEADPTKPMKLPDVYVKDAIETRLRMVVPYKSSWPQAMALLTLPPNVPPALANLLTLADDICYYAGDRSVDFDWYTRRVALAAIYKATELYMLQDKSEDHRETWEFLERRIDDAMQLNRWLGVSLPPPDQAINKATEAASAAFITVRQRMKSKSYDDYKFIRHEIYLD